MKTLILGLTIDAKIYYCNSIDIEKSTIAIVLILPVTIAILLHELQKIKIRFCFRLIPLKNIVEKGEITAGQQFFSFSTMFFNRQNKY